MKLKEHAEAINKLLKAGHGELELWFASDNEGNGYHRVVYTPCLGQVESGAGEVVESFDNSDDAKGSTNGY